jgi:hypothetical protein
MNRFQMNTGIIRKTGHHLPAGNCGPEKQNGPKPALMIRT